MNTATGLKFVVRTPETDRKVILVPQKLADLTDYSVNGPVAGVGSSSKDVSVASGLSPTAFTFDAGTSLVNCTFDGSYLIPTYGGLFNLSVVNSWLTSGGASLPSPSTVQRGMLLTVNGAGVTALYSTYATLGGTSVDNGTITYRLNAGDRLGLSAFQVSGSALKVHLPQLTINRIAP